MKGYDISLLQETDTDFGVMVRHLQPTYNFKQFVEDDSPDEAQPLVNELQEYLGDISEVWSYNDFTLYHEGPVYRLCQSDMNGSYSIYLW